MPSRLSDAVFGSVKDTVAVFLPRSARTVIGKGTLKWGFVVSGAETLDGIYHTLENIVTLYHLSYFTNTIQLEILELDSKTNLRKHLGNTHFS